MCLVAPTINIKLVEVADEGVVRARLGSILWVQIDPLLLNGLELGQVVKVDSTLACVASKEENTVFE